MKYTYGHTQNRDRTWENAEANAPRPADAHEQASRNKRDDLKADSFGSNVRLMLERSF